MSPLHPRRRGWGEIDLYDIETDGNATTEEGKPIPCADAQESTFGVIDGARGGAELRRYGAFDLANDEIIGIPRHDIKLTAPPPTEVAAQDAQTMSAQKGSRHELRISAAVLLVRSRFLRIPGAAPSVQQAQTSGDGVE